MSFLHDINHDLLVLLAGGFFWELSSLKLRQRPRLAVALLGGVLGALIWAHSL